MPARLATLLFACLVCGCNSLQPVSTANSGYEASVAAGPNGIAVAWYDDRNGNADIYLSLFDSALHPRLAEVRLTDSPDASYEADVVWLGANLGVAWYEIDVDRRSHVMLGLWNDRLERQWTRELTSDRSGRVPELVAVAGELFIAWIEDYDRPDGAGRFSDIRGARLDANGDFTQTPFFIASASTDTWNLNADVAGNGKVVLVYDADYATEASELLLTVVDGDVAATYQLTDDDLVASKYPDIALHGSTAAISWHDEKDGNQEIYLGLLDLDVPLNGSAPRHLDLETVAQRITNTPGESIGAYLTWHDDTLGLAWCDNSAGSHQIFFRDFSNAGIPRHAAQRLTYTPADSLIPAIEATTSGFVLAWNEALIDGHGTARNRTTSRVMARLVP